MKITRIDRNREMNQEVNIIRVSIGDQEYEMHEKFGELSLMTPDGERLYVSPGVSNVIIIFTRIENNT